MNATAILVALGIVFVILIIVMAIKKDKVNLAAKSIGYIRCNRCGHVDTPMTTTSFVLLKGASTAIKCRRCKSEDWVAYQA